MSHQVNGDMSRRTSSRCFNHLSQYPVLQDGAERFMTYSFGQWSIERGNSIYSSLSIPASIRPYISKADEYVDKALSVLDDKFPATKKPTEELVSDAKTLAMRPKEHVFQVYRDEQQRAGDGLVASGQALLHTSVVLGTQIWGTIYSYLRGQAEQQGATSGSSQQQANRRNGNKSNGSAH